MTAVGIASLVSALLTAAFVGFVFWWAAKKDGEYDKAVQRRRFLNKLRVARITPGELHQKMIAGDPLLIVDMRHPGEIAETKQLPGALRIGIDELDARHHEIARDRDIILYCS